MHARSCAAAALVVAVLAAPLLARAASDEAEEGERPATRTLFDRAGGTYTLARVGDIFVDTMLADPAIRANAAVREAAKLSHRPGLKFQITSLLCQEAGGPCKYEGRSLRESHHGLGITGKEWDAMMRAFNLALARAQVPAAERLELANIVTASKGDIVTK
jgi:hemoglobin